MFTYPYPKVETLYRSIAFFASDVSLSKLSLSARYVKNTLPVRHFECLRPLKSREKAVEKGFVIR